MNKVMHLNKLMLVIGVASTVFLASCGNDTDNSKTPKVTPKITL